MGKLTPENITEVAVERFSGTSQGRTKEVMASLIRHLHDFVREVELTPDEWLAGMNFLAEVGHMTDDKRQEFILLSDTLGVSALVDLLASRDNPPESTETSLLGPFFREGAPQLPLGASIAESLDGERILVQGRVSSTDGRPLGGASVDVWQAAPNGLYDLQDDSQPDMNFRARFEADHGGRFRFVSVKPSSYSVPHDGPVGRMLRALGRHPYRPAHIHFRIAAEGYRPLTTALYIAGDRYLDSDAVFGAREGLVVDYKRGAGANGFAQEGDGVDMVEFDFALSPVNGA